MKKLLSQKEYVKKKGQICPACGGPASAEDGPEMEGSDIWQNCSCEACGAIWVDYYKLSGYNNFEPGEPSDPAVVAANKTLAGTGYQVAANYNVVHENGDLIFGSATLDAALAYISGRMA